MKPTEVELQTQRALSPQPNLVHSRAMLVDSTTRIQVVAQWNCPGRPRRILAASMTSAPPVQARRICASKARVDSAAHSTTCRGRTAISSLLGAV